MKKFILVLVAVIVAATEISSATEISRECNYKEKASDKDIQGRYENITDYSNEIILELPIGDDPNYRELAFTAFEDSSCYLVHVDEIIENSSIFIYGINIEVYTSTPWPREFVDVYGMITRTVMVELVAKVPVTSNTVQVPTLLKGKTYVVIYSSNDYDKKERIRSILERKYKIEGLPIGADPNSRERTITVSDDNSCYLVYVDEIIENSSIFIYTIDSVLVAKVPVTSHSHFVQGPILLKGKTYVVKYSFNDKIKRKKSYWEYYKL